ncbi:unnamed protein product, partial [Linum tenue]
MHLLLDEVDIVKQEFFITSNPFVKQEFFISWCKLCQVSIILKLSFNAISIWCVRAAATFLALLLRVRFCNFLIWSMAIVLS